MNSLAAMSLSISDPIPLSLILLGIATTAAWFADSRACRTVLRHPGLLVPAAMSAVLALFARESFGTVHPGVRDLDRVSNYSELLYLGIQALLIAGLVGLIESRERGVKPDGLGFAAGIRRHTPALALAILVLSIVQHAFFGAVLATPALGLLLLIPSTMLGTVAATASHSPGRIFRPLRDGVDLALRNPRPCAQPVVALAGFLVVQSALLEDSLSAVAGFGVDYLNCHILSFQSFPLAILPSPPFFAILTTVCSGFVSTVCITACWQRTTLELRRESTEAASLD